jgi:putative ABC transport system substrate-binding protein
MRRRAFLTLLGGAAAAWPLAARAQQRSPTIGFLGPSTASVARERIAIFTQRLRELGWVEGQTLAIAYRWADGKTALFAPLAAELVALKVDVIVTWGTATAVAVKQATSAIPAVFAVVGDPVGSGLVASLARPGGNITGLSTQHADAVGKRLDLLRETVPDLRRLAIMANAGNAGALQEMRECEQAARGLGIEVVKAEVRRSEDIRPAVEALRDRAQAVYVTSDALMNTSRITISGAALAARLPTMHGFRDIVEAGGLLSYGPSYPEQFRRAAEYVDRILRGAKPVDLPVEQPTRFELVINLKTAKALGLEVPPTLLARADEVIE